VFAFLFKAFNKKLETMMKLVYLLSVAAIATATTLNASAFDADLKGKNENQLKATVMQERRAINQLRALGVAQPHHAHLRNGHADVTDTDILLETIGTADCDPYVQAVKAKIDAVIDGWVDTILPGGNAALFEVQINGNNLAAAGANVAVGGHDFVQTANLDRDSFKAALHQIVADMDYGILDAIYAAAPPPGLPAHIGSARNAKLSELKRVETAVGSSMNEILVEVMNHLDATNAGAANDGVDVSGADLLVAAAGIGGAAYRLDGVDYAMPANRTDGAFREALTNLFTVAIANR